MRRTRERERNQWRDWRRHPRDYDPRDYDGYGYFDEPDEKGGEDVT